ncbi:MAG: SufD family Fe-S cluster assembly protein [Actinobacteria bacterium]|nr:SufD family Fe-S cluster assembly protein [Actinomycetota bacterium]MBU1943187.1 SufD family Fe-S cluster assembly protein [Actinomycetota bacterium]MBU2687865.1 SufD family Fe-S cluster assembly protein [Actinomycetota bacterium]
MPERAEVRKKAEAARQKPGKFGPDIELSEYTLEAPAYEPRPLAEIDLVDRERLLSAGVDVSGEGRSGSFIQVDKSVIHASPTQEGIEVTSTRAALETYDWLEEYLWQVVSVDADKYTASAELNFQDGYFIRALPGARTVFPVQACLYLKEADISQNVHNIIIAEEGSELHIITGCATDSPELRGLHVGISEFYVKKNAKISFSMIHNWAPKISVRPRSGIRVEEGGVFLNNFICLHPVETLQLFPAAFLVGEGATARFNSVMMAPEGSHMDVGSKAVLSAPGTRCEMIARSITTGGEVINRGLLIGEVAGVKAHLECRGMILKGGGRIYAIPELDGKVEGVDMSHEAAVGKIARDEVEYLMARGLSEDEAVATIVRGFMNVDIEGLPPVLAEQIEQAIELSQQSLL